MPETQPSETLIRVPTYYGDKAGEEKQEFDAPWVPVVVRDSQGIRIVLGARLLGHTCADVQIERRANGWMIFLHPNGGSDPSGYVFFLDDGRSFLVPESDLSATPICRVAKWDEVIADVDRAADPNS